MFYLTKQSTHFIYGYMASNIWYRTTQIARGNPISPYGLFFRLAGIVLNMQYPRQDSTYHSLCKTSRVLYVDCDERSPGHETSFAYVRSRLKKLILLRLTQNVLKNTCFLN